MSTGAIIGIVIVVIGVAAAAVAASELQRARMRRQFGPEYDRLAKELGRKKADAELTARQRRVAALGIHPLTPGQAAPVTYFHKVASAAHRDEPDLLAPAGRRDDVAAVASPDGMTADEEEGEQTSSSRWPPGCRRPSRSGSADFAAAGTAGFPRIPKRCARRCGCTARFCTSSSGPQMPRPASR